MAYENYIISAPVGALEVGAALGLNTGDIGTLCRSDMINPMAKYKPVRNTKKEDLIATDFIAAKYGLQMPSSFASNNPNPDAVWTYNKPVFASGHFARITDFDGYDNKASAPFAFDVTGAEIAGCVGIPIYINQSAGTYYSQKGGTRRWRQDTCITLYDMLSLQGSTQQGYTNYYLSFCIHDLTTSGNILVVTNQKIGSLSTSVPTIILHADEVTQSGITYPAIPLFQDRTRAGHTFRFIAALCANGPANEITHAYEVFDSSLASRDVYSLAFTYGIDRKDVVMNLYDTISGLTASLQGQNLMLSFVRDTSTMYEYRLTGRVLGNFTTPNVWRRKGVGVEVQVHADQGYVEDTDVIYSTYANIPVASKTYTGLQLVDIDVPVYIYHGVGTKTVTISAWATNITERVNFTNTLTVTAIN